MHNFNNFKYGLKLNDKNWSLDSKTKSRVSNNTYLNNFEIFNKLFKKTKIKNFKMEILVVTPTRKRDYFKSRYKALGLI